MKDFKETQHPSYGQLYIGRAQTNKTSLYGSGMLHDNVIVFELKTSKLNRGLGRDWYYGDKVIASCALSPAQFTQLITSMNVGEGVPVTLTQVGGERIDSCPYEGKLEQSYNEFEQDCQKILATSHSSINEILSRLDDKKPLTVTERKEMQNRLKMIVQDVEANLPFAKKCFDEQVQKGVTEAKAEIEAAFDNRIHQLGIEAFKDSLQTPQLAENFNPQE